MTDAYDALVVDAVLDVWGRAVTYTPTVGAAVAIRGHYTPEPVGGDLPLAGPRLEVRASDLTDASITPTKGTDTVTLVVRDETRTYRVTDVYPEDNGMLLLTLGERS